MVVGSLDIETDIVIIGAGPGGYTAALRAAKQGHEVIVVDRDAELGGVCLHWGCIPTKTLIHSTDYHHVVKELEYSGVVFEGDVYADYQKILEHKDNVIDTLANGIQSLFKKHGIEVIKGYARFEDENTLHISGQSDVTSIAFKKCILSTGGKPIEIPTVPYSHPRVLSSRDLLQLEDLPSSLIIVGGGYIGTEMGTVFGKLGVDIDIIEMSPNLISVMPQDVVDIVEDTIGEYNVEAHTNTAAQGVEDSEDGVVLVAEKDGETKRFKADYILTVPGRSPNTDDLGLENIGVKTNDHGFIPVNESMQTKHSHIFAIGDIVGQPMLAHKSMREGKIAANKAIGKDDKYDNMVIPKVVFNDPEIACVGFSEEEAQEQGKETITGTFQMNRSGRAQSLGNAKGFIRVIADKDTHRILGVESVGPQVSGMIGEATLAIELGAKLEDVARTIHAHPTINEAFMEACEVALGEGIHE